MRQVRKERNAASFEHELGQIDDAAYRDRIARTREVEDRVVGAYNKRWMETVEPVTE